MTTTAIIRKHLLRIHHVLSPRRKTLILSLALAFYLMLLAAVVILRHWNHNVIAGLVTAIAVGALALTAVWVKISPKLDQMKE